MWTCAGILRRRSCNTHFETDPGNHVRRREERLAEELAS